jgi:hypothetical protein
MLDAQARVEGLWPRDTVDVLLMWQDVKARAHDVAVRSAGSGGGVELSDLDVPARFTLGVFYAARWTLNLAGRRPLTGLESPVTDAALRGEIAIAEYLIESNAPTWDMAAGVRAWLGWIVGVVDDIAYPSARR